MQRMGRERHRVFVKSGVTADTTEELLERHFSTFGTVTDVYIPRSLPGPTPKGFAYVSFETDDAVLQAVKEAVHEIEGKHYPVGRAEPRPAERSTWHHEERNSMPIAEPLLPWPQRYSRSLSPRGGLLPGPHGGGMARLDMRSALAHTPPLHPDAAPLGDIPPFGSRPALPFTEGYGLDGRLGISGRMPMLPSERISRSTRVFVGGLPDALVERHVRAHFQKFGLVEDVYFPRERHTGKRRGFCFVRFDTPRAAHFAAVQTPRVILGYEVGEIKVADERPEDFGNDEPVEVGPETDRFGYGPPRGYLPERGYGPERRSGYKFAPPPYYELGRQLPHELARDLPRELPRDLPRELPTEFPTEFPIEFPTEFPTEFPREFPTEFPREIPRAFDGRVPIRYRPY